MENKTIPGSIEQPTGSDASSMFGPVICSYSRAQAIADGVLVDVSAMAREAGFSVPVAMTSAAWADYVEWSDQDSNRQVHQDESGRLWDVLWMSHLAARHAHEGIVAVRLYRLPRGGRGRMPRMTTLYMHIGPGDAGEAVITLMCTCED